MEKNIKIVTRFNIVNYKSMLERPIIEKFFNKLRYYIKTLNYFKEQNRSPRIISEILNRNINWDCILFKIDDSFILKNIYRRLCKW